LQKKSFYFQQGDQIGFISAAGQLLLKNIVHVSRPLKCPNNPKNGMPTYIQGCLIFFGSTNQNGKNAPKCPQKNLKAAIKYTNAKLAMPSCQVYTKLFHLKAFQNIQGWHFWHNNIPSGNPADKCIHMYMGMCIHTYIHM
jgi:hypothetical protein